MKLTELVKTYFVGQEFGKQMHLLYKQINTQ